MRVPGPPSSASADVGADARSVAEALGLADAVSLVLLDGPAEADAVALAEGVADAWPFTVAVGDVPPAGVVDPEVALGVVGFGVVGFGFEVVGFGFDVVFVGVGVLVFVAAGGAMPGCWPEPNRKPTTEPGAGS
jgi:hypothetical protein